MPCNGSVKTLPRNEYKRNKTRTVGQAVFHDARIVLNTHNVVKGKQDISSSKKSCTVWKSDINFNTCSATNLYMKHKQECKARSEEVSEYEHTH
jgi:hypothetical protein